MQGGLLMQNLRIGRSTTLFTSKKRKVRPLRGATSNVNPPGHVREKIYRDSHSSESGSRDDEEISNGSGEGGGKFGNNKSGLVNEKQVGGNGRFYDDEFVDCRNDREEYNNFEGPLFRNEAIASETIPLPYERTFQRDIVMSESDVQNALSSSGEHEMQCDPRNDMNSVANDQNSFNTDAEAGVFRGNVVCDDRNLPPWRNTRRKAKHRCFHIV